MKKLNKLIIKYLTNSITQKEWEDLTLWAEKTKDSDSFQEYLKINYAIDDIMSEFNTKKTKESVLQKIKKDKSKLHRLKMAQVLKYAAVAIILLGLGYFYEQGFVSDREDFAFPSEDTITLELENGAMEVISEGEATEIINQQGVVIGTQKGNRLIYTNTQVESEKLIYNQLTVPFGKRFELEFSDGTVAHLNAGSSIKYPIQFLKGQEREIFLDGEAFLDVAKDPSRPFTVNTSNNLHVRVLGTQFNVSNYSEDKTIDVVLVEGSVALQVDKNKEDVILEPGFKGSFNRQENNISTKPVLTSTYTSWINGDLVLRGMNFKNILKKLERHYNVTIINQNLEYSNKKFNANFGDEPIETILNYFKNTYGINYTINANKIIIQ